MTDLRTTIEGGVAIVTITRPPVNALTIGSYVEITETFERLSADDEVRCVVLTGDGERAFSAGFDFRAFAVSGGVEDDPRRPEILHRMFQTVRDCAIPVIAAVNGPAIGSGCVLAAVCDIRIASHKARFGLPEIDFNRVGGSAHLARLVPPGALRRMAFTGKPVDADEALRIGLADELASSEGLYDVTLDLARTIAAKPPIALRLTKRALGRLGALSIDEGYAFEQALSRELRAALEDETE
ncbi:enoyl-CoA hydratase/isomerase family protein [Sphingomonas oryzagri]